MAVSAFKSTSKRGSHASPSSRTYSSSSSSSKQPLLDDSGKKIPSRRSRSVSAAPRSYADRLPAKPSVSEFSSTTDNPLFGCSSSSSPESEKREGIIRTGTDASSCRRGRSVSRSSGSGKESSGRGPRRVSGRSLSRGPNGCSESEVEHGYRSASSLRSKEVCTFGSNGREATDECNISEVTRNLQTWTSRHPASKSWDTTSSINHQSPDAGAGGIYETVQSEVCCAASEIRDDLENCFFQRKNHSNTAVENITDVPLDLSPGAIELVSDIRREYAEKLEQSQVRAQILRADLAVEEQREKELSRILKDIIPVPKSSETRKGRPRRKTSIERVKMSRRLEEEAINYFEECVSISTFDSSDLSSLEEPQPSSVVGIQPMGRNKIFPNECPTFSASHFPFPHDPLNHHEGSDNQTQCSISIAGSDIPGGSICSGINASDPINDSIDIDNLVALDTPKGGRPHFSFTHQPAEDVQVHDIRQYIKKFEKDSSKEHMDHVKVRSSYSADDYILISAESLLLDKVIFKNRIESGGLLVCEVRTF